MTERVISYGQLTTRRRLLLRGSLLGSGGVLWLLVFLGIPSLLLIVVAFTTRGEYGEIIWKITAANFRKLLGFGVFGWSADYLWIFGRTIVVATVTTVACVALSYPMAFFIARRTPRWRYFWLICVIIPFCTNLIIRTYGWQLILGRLYPSAFAVYCGMISSNLSFALLPIYTNVERIDWSIVEAARDLGASGWRVFRHGILPQTKAGLSVAIIITFIPSLGMFVVSDLLGGGKYMLIGNLIQQQFGASRNFPFGAAITLLLILAMLIGLRFIRSRTDDRGIL